jgi:hypothetical protein
MHTGITLRRPYRLSPNAHFDVTISVTGKCVPTYLASFYILHRRTRWIIWAVNQKGAALIN